MCCAESVTDISTDLKMLLARYDCQVGPLGLSLLSGHHNIDCTAKPWPPSSLQ
jgi:hypothetical protein